ncbi:hypothetical protein GALMADRAFT_447163 [Galerina marginata CBS 339.88]|uniref:Uncharacterized protein n=1 Tax=Galerina marginata (strain CBS 339.88) TaxID=685588 RepID=A0A067T2F8_GALM3|nr:hypothetical protein GALMADRAFT_447163 [Galerina marginata CBS 339.88]
MFRDARTQQTAMSKLHFFSHPEIESRSSLSFNDETAACGRRTLLDLLEIYPRKVVWKERLNHTLLLHHFQEEKSEGMDNPGKPHPLRIFFVEDLNFGPQSSSLDPDSQSTPHWFHNHFGVTPVFLDCLRSPKQSVTIGNASFIRREQGRRVALDGMYRYSADLSAPPRPPRPPAHVWFSQSLACDRGSTYIIHHCPDEARRLILSCAMGSNFQSLLRPLAIDIFLAEDCVTEWVQRVSQTRNELLKYVSRPFDLHLRQFAVNLLIRSRLFRMR